jgi:hypothetical protein
MDRAAALLGAQQLRIYMSYRTRGRCQLGKWLVAASLAAALIPAFAAPTADWSYRVRPGDTIWDLAARFLKPDVPWQKLQGYNNVADPLHLPPGMTMHVPVAWLRLRPAPAKIIAVIGNATAKSTDAAQATPVVKDMSVGFGTDLVTLAGASLTLELADGSTARTYSCRAIASCRWTASANTAVPAWSIRACGSSAGASTATSYR